MIELITNAPHPIHLVDSLCNLQLFAELSKDLPIIFVTNSKLQTLLIPPLLKTAHSLGFSTQLLVIPEGEKAKTGETFLSLHKQMTDLAIPREATLIGVGGGVVLDISGFVAATYCRGMPFISVPTTLVAMIDASIGGKNGINLGHIKNRIGSFYLPKDVWICPKVLHTLPKKNFYHGIAECIKHAYIVDSSILPLLQNPASLHTLDHLSCLIKQNCLCKASVVEKDFRDCAIRQILNFGHTIGHALEMVFKEKIAHGLAVSVGMVLETKLSLFLGIARDTSILCSLIQDLQRYRLPISLQELYMLTREPFHSIDQILYALSYDKKKQNTFLPPFVMIEEIGRAAAFDSQFCLPISKHIVTQFLEEEFYAMRYC